MCQDNFRVFLKNSYTRRIACKVLSEKVNIAELDLLSDYDIFSAICDYYPLMAGHSLRKTFDQILLNNGLSVDPFKIQDSEYKKAIWKKIYFPEESTFDALDISKVNALNKYGERRYKSEEFFFLNEKIDITCKDIFSLLEKILYGINRGNKKIIYCDISEIEYRNTDDYHANKAYISFKENSCISAELLLWLLCRLSMRNDYVIYLKTDTVEKAKKVIELIYARRAFPHIYLSFDLKSREEIENIFDFYLQNYKKNISLEFYFSKEISIEKMSSTLCETLNIIPLGMSAPSEFLVDMKLYNKALKLALEYLSENQVERDFLLNY